MDDSKFHSGEIVTTNFTKSGSLVPIPKQNNSTFLVPFVDGVSPLENRQTGYALVKSQTPEEFLPDIGRWVTVGGFALLGIFVAAVGLSAVLKYKVTVQAAAAIRPVGELGQVQSPIEGSVLNIAVRENQLVKVGDPIATIQDARLESKLQTRRSQLSGDIQKGKQQIFGIDAQILSLDRQGVAEREQSSRSIAGIQAELTRAQRDYHDKTITTQAEVAEAQANLQTAEREREAAEVELQVATANLNSIQQGYSAALAKSNRYKDYAGAISTNQLEEASASAAQQKYAIVAQQATIRKQQRIVARLAASVRATAARLQRSQAALDPSPAELAIVREKIAREQANGRAAMPRLQQERDKLLQQRVEIANQIATNEKELAQVSIELKPTTILAPIAGTVQELNLRNQYQVVRPGDRVAQIVPQNAALEIKVIVAPGDIDNVKVGQIAQMRVSACTYTDLGVLTGKVISVAADAKQLDRTGGNNAAKQPQAAMNSTYEVTIEPDTLMLKNRVTKCRIRSGMEGRAEIISKEETVLQFVLRKARLLVNL
jgi:multidrug efflux pump subunit AcrA (membrane-fusion protein)